MIQCLLTYCITTELYDPALTLEGMQPHNSEEQGNILLLITHSFSTLFGYRHPSICSRTEKCVSVQRLDVHLVLRSVMKRGLILFDLIAICANTASA